MPPKKGTSKTDKQCNKCLLMLKDYITCMECKKVYHPSCILTIPGTYVEKKGEIYCCRNITFETPCGCKSRDEEIEELRERLKRANLERLETSLLEYTLNNNDEANLPAGNILGTQDINQDGSSVINDL